MDKTSRSERMMHTLEFLEYIVLSFSYGMYTNKLWYKNNTIVPQYFLTLNASNPQREFEQAFFIKSFKEISRGLCRIRRQMQSVHPSVEF